MNHYPPPVQRDSWPEPVPESESLSESELEAGYADLDYGGHLVDESTSAAMVSLTRRRMLQGMLATGVAGYGAMRLAGRGGSSSTSPIASAQASTATGNAGDAKLLSATNVVAPADVESAASSQIYSMLQPAPVDQRVLVLIELEGGNDGHSTVIPYESGKLRDLRGDYVPDGASVRAFDDEIGLSPHLSRVSQRQYAVVEGVGPVDGVLSHFEMASRWGMGDMSGRGGERSGFLARLADAVDVGAPLTGLSVDGYTPRFNNAASSILAVENLSQLRVLTNSDWIYPSYRRAVQSIGGGPLAKQLAGSWGDLWSIGGALGRVERPDDKSSMVTESRMLGLQLAMAAQAIKADVGVRVIHARLNGFDTHKGHEGRHKLLLEQLDIAVDGFLSLLADAGLADRVLVATSSEFGRRAAPNGSGFDHGAASSMLMFGPVLPRRYGEPSPINNLDSNGNFKTTVPFDRYLATLAQEWLGADAASVLPGGSEGLGVF